MRWPLVITLFVVAACGGTDTTDRTLGDLGSDGSGGSASSGGSQSISTGGLSTSGGLSASGGSGGSTTGLDCKPGRYVGNFDGTYRSQAWGNGETELMIQGQADPLTMTEPLEFRLEKQESVVCSPGDEFCGGFKVTGGKMQGGADPFNSGFFSVHFEIDLTGELDCRTGEFRGKLSNGFYDVATVLFYFDGDIIGDYDGTNASFNNGTWNVKEQEDPNALFPPGSNIGGEGTWNASWVEP